MKTKIKSLVSFDVAMDNISSIADIDLDALSPIGIIGGTRLVSSEEDFPHDTVKWLSGEGVEPVMDLLELTYRSIHQHLIGLHDNAETDWDSEKFHSGVFAMMDLVGESTQKMDRYFSSLLGKQYKRKVSDLDAFKALQRYYTQVFVKDFKSKATIDSAWESDWQNNPESLLLDATHTGLQDFESIKKDIDYELFYIQNSEGKPYFSPSLLRNIKLTCDFDLDSTSFEEDPILKVRSMQDRDLHAAASQILAACHGVISEYYKAFHKLVGNELSESLGMALIALFAAANPRNLLQNTMGKSSMQYFEDFHLFLRRAMKTSEYQKLIAYLPDSSDKAGQLLLDLTNLLCRHFFEKLGGIKLETIGLIHRAMRKGGEFKRGENEHLVRGDSIWNQLLLDDELFRTFLSKFPNGPIFKILDLIREEEDKGPIAFDPILQDNYPNKEFDLFKGEKKIEVIRLPSPTKQMVIDKAEVIDEYKAFLRSLSKESPTKKHLLINLQDRNSWKEYARSRALESLQFNPEFHNHVVVISIPKCGSFYYQINEYLNLNKSDEFIKTIQTLLSKPEEAGFFFPPQLKTTDLSRFIEICLPLIHKHFFDGKNSLTRRNREDFLEIFYQFLILKCIDVIDPSFMSFSCKDAIDIGPSSSAMFFGFLEIVAGDFSKREVQDYFRWLLYTPALFIRERAVDQERITRTLSVLERVSANVSDQKELISKAFSELYRAKTFQTLGVKKI